MTSITHKGKVYRIYPTVNKDNRKISLQVIARDLKVGMFGEGKLITSDEANQSQAKPQAKPQVKVATE